MKTSPPAARRRAAQLATAAAALVLLLVVPACSMLPNHKPKPEPPPVARVPPPPPTDGAIFQAGQQMELFSDLKARRVGDVLTIVLNESITGSKAAVTKTTKTTATANTGPTILGRSITHNGVPILDTTLNGSNTFDGEGSSTQSNSLAGSLTVTVMEVKANGNLVVQGDKTLKLNQGDEFVRLSGVVRPADIATNNTVTSDKLADARISYSGKGAVAQANSMGWLARFFNSPISPY